MLLIRSILGHRWRILLIIYDEDPEATTGRRCLNQSRPWDFRLTRNQYGDDFFIHNQGRHRMLATLSPYVLIRLDERRSGFM